MNSEIIKIKKLNKIYNQNKDILNILNDIDFTVNKGDIISITGPSGSGKSTFLNILGLLDSEFIGDYYFLQKDVKKLKCEEKNSIRNQSIGFVHQFFHLIPELNVIENVILPNLIKNNDYNESLLKSKDILINFDLEGRIKAKPINLSGGEKQRVAIARSMVNDPDIIFADEMTGNLDGKTSDSVFNFFLDKIKLNSQTLIYVTHNKDYSVKADKQYIISNQNLERIS